MVQSERVRVRPARPGDVPVLYRMKQALTREEGNDAVLRASERDWTRDGFGPDARFRIFVAEADDAVVAMATYSEVYLTALGGTVFSVQDLYVDPAWRRHGLGRALLAQVATAAIEHGIPLIQLNVLESNAARKFYRRLGFQHLRECLTYAVGGKPMLALALADDARRPAEPAKVVNLP
ncbi:MAG TPA: GNAT family N-acetyltransferase [Stellaceae bacterium]|nr:GNAT family N-acetyltransferase [Stellaceae bacterium]